MVNESSILAIFLLPLASFVVIGLVIRPFFNMYSWLSGYLLIVALVLSVVLSASVLNAVVMGQEVQLTAIPWLDVGGGAVIEFSLFVDPLTAVMLLVVTSVSLMVQIYSLGYMRGDPSYARYFAYMSLFTASMLGLVLAANVIVLYAFWELVGVSSYLLIGFWHDRPAAAAAAKKAFLITRIGDVGFLLAILYLFFQADEFAAAGLNPFHIPDIFQAAAPLAAGSAILGGAGLTWLTLGIFAGAVGKSGQFPPPLLAARRDGRSHTSQCPDSRRNHGCRRSVPGGAFLSAIPGRAARSYRRGLGGGFHSVDGSHHGLGDE